MHVQATSKIDEYARGMISGSGSTLFEELGLYYIGPVDGHKMSDLVDVLQGVLPNSWVYWLMCCRLSGEQALENIKLEQPLLDRNSSIGWPCGIVCSPTRVPRLMLMWLCTLQM